MKAKQNRAKLKALLREGGLIVVPGAYDPVSAMLVEKAGFPVAYVGSYATSAARFGLPDVGLVSMDQMVAHAAAVADAVDIPVLADAENGWANAANIWRTVQAFEKAGISGVHIEDHEFGKHTTAPPVLLSMEETVQKIRAAVDAREDENFLIIGRTDAVWALANVDEAIDRMNAYTEAGADLVMPAGIRARVLKENRSRIKGKVVVTDKRNVTTADEAEAGASIVLYYGFTLHIAYHAIESALEIFKKTGDAEQVPHLRDQVARFEDFIGYRDFTARAKKYAAS